MPRVKADLSNTPTVITRSPKSGKGRKKLDRGGPGGRKHVTKDLFVDEFPAHDKGAHDGVKEDCVTIEYDPHPKQDIFAMAIERGAKIIFFLAGIRSGKTVAGAYEAVKQLYKYDATPNLAFMVSPTNAMTRTPIRIFQNAAGNALVSYKRSSDQGPAHFLMKPTQSSKDPATGKEFYYVIEHHSGEHPDRMRGPTIAWAWLDEPQIMKPEVIDIIRGRVMESGGIIILTGTASFPGQWTKTDIIDRAWRCGKCGVCVYDHYDLVNGPDGQPLRDANGKETREYGPKDHEPTSCTGDPRIAVITCSTFDNTYLKASAIQELKQDYALKDPVIARRELFAEYTGFEGLVYSHFDRNSHKSEFTAATVPANAYISAGIDFGLNDPFVCVFMAKIGDGWHVVSEYYWDQGERSLDDHFKGIMSAAGPLFKRVKNWWHDPSGRIVAMELSRRGLRPMKSARKRMSSGQTWRNYRIEVVTSHLVARDEKDKPLFRIAPHCRGTLADFEGRKWKRYSSKGDDGIVRIIDNKGHEVDRNAGDDPAPGHDHATDAVEYCLASEFVRGLYKPKPAKSEIMPNAFKDSPQLTNLGQHLAASLAEKGKQLLSGKPGIGSARPSW